MRALRVAFDNSLARKNRAGTGAYATNLTRELALEPALNLEILGGPDIGSGDGFISRALRRGGNIYWSQWGLTRFLRQGNFDVLHCPAFVAPTDSPCPSVVTIHDLTFALFPEHFQGGWRAYLTSRMPAILHSVSAVICISEQTRKDLLSLYKVPADKAHVVYNGVDHARFHPAARLNADWARDRGLRSGYVLHMGSLAARKNIPTLLKAVAYLRSRGKWGDRQVVLAGTKSRGLYGAEEVYDNIKGLGLADITLLPGHVSEQHVPGLYSEAAALVMPTLYEGFGLPILEAMASGTPVVASDNSSIPEVAGDAALLVPTTDVYAFADAIEKILEDGKIAAGLREAGLRQAAKFSWKRAAMETARVYRQAAGKEV